MDKHAAFKCGFLLRCAEEGLGPAEAEARAARMIKAAEDPLGIGTLASLPVKALAVSALAGGAAGAVGGGALARLTEPDVDVADVRKRELTAAYQHFAEEAERMAKRRAQLAAAGAGRRPGASWRV